MSSIHVPAGEGQHSPMIDGDSARIVAITSGNRAGRFFADFAGSVPAGRPVEESLEAILSITQRHGVRLADR